MDPHVTALDIAGRLAAALFAGGLIGYDRGTRGRIAGLRTTILMCLAAAAAMIEANLMLGVTGKTASSFATMDALRFPLGILSGIGFIGAGAIVRRGRLVTGVTTAATLWLITVIGLIFGAGYLALGAALTIVAFLVLTVLKVVEPRLFREHRAQLKISLMREEPPLEAVRAFIERHGFEILTMAIAYDETRKLDCRVEWSSSRGQDTPPDLVAELAGQHGVLGVVWQPINAGLLEE